MVNVNDDGVHVESGLISKNIARYRLDSIFDGQTSAPMNFESLHSYRPRLNIVFAHSYSPTDLLSLRLLMRRLLPHLDWYKFM